MTKVAVIGASGYTGAELAQLIQQHPQFELGDLFVSEGSADKGKPLAQLYPNLIGKVSQLLLPLTPDAIAEIGGNHDAVCLALDHRISAQLAPQLLAQGLVVFDLSGGHRFGDPNIYSEFYGFEHPAPQLLAEAAYGLAEWHPEKIAAAQLVAVPGCYPTASLIALKPLKLAKLIASGSRPVINAVSGVTGAGRKISLNSSFCEVSLTAYGVLEHRHQPEIEQQLDNEVIFTPHLGAFKRGILATITVEVPSGTKASDVAAAYDIYTESGVVHLLPPGQWPKVEDVANTPNCLLSWKLDSERSVLVISSAIDNLLKGAASQALQCMIIRFKAEAA